MQGEPCLGIVDIGSDITIIGGDLFKKIATVAKLRKKNFREAEDHWLTTSSHLCMILGSLSAIRSWSHPYT